MSSNIMSGRESYIFMILMMVSIILLLLFPLLLYNRHYNPFSHNHLTSDHSPHYSIIISSWWWWLSSGWLDLKHSDEHDVVWSSCFLSSDDTLIWLSSLVSRAPLLMIMRDMGGKWHHMMRRRNRRRNRNQTICIQAYHFRSHFFVSSSHPSLNWFGWKIYVHQHHYDHDG